MTYKLRITLAARLEEQQAYNYYEDIQEGLGDRFLKELEERYENICKHPEYYSFVGEGKLIRDVALKRFPYTIVFSVLDDIIFVLSVFNTYQMPRSWD